MRHTILTSTDLLPILNPGLYETAISPSEVFDCEMQELAEELPEDINPFDMAIDLNKYTARLLELANEVIEAEVLPALKPYGVIDIKAATFYHPSQYRLFSGAYDIINLNILVDDTFNEKMEKELARICNDDKAKEYVSKNWRSYPGFCSYMPETVEELATDWAHFSEVRQESGYLTLLCREKGLLWRNDETEEDGEVQRLWEEKVNCNLFFSDFISEEDYARIESCKVEA